LSKAGLILSNLATALIVGVGTSMFWIGAYGNGDREVAAGGGKADLALPEITGAEDVAIGPSGLAIPVAGVKPDRLTDTFTEARAGGERVHDAIDIMAPRGTPVVAAAPGRVERLFFSEGGGGITAYVRSDDGRWMYYYAHLDAYAPGLKEGQRVGRGTPIGTVGSTGNASPEGPHLHFAIARMSDGESWYQGTPVNPYPLLAGNRGAR
jgi:murein DD-endopeptidase MepM/ murein hydrolase activator NlpD